MRHDEAQIIPFGLAHHLLRGLRKLVGVQRAKQFGKLAVATPWHLKFDTQSSISQIFLANFSVNSSICIGFLVEIEKLA